MKVGKIMLFKKLRYIIILNLPIITYSLNTKQLQTGDLLLQDLSCGVQCHAINQATAKHSESFNHVGIIYKYQNITYLIEASSDNVHLISLDEFLNNSNQVTALRLKPKYYQLIPKFIKFSISQIGKPYNYTYIPNDEQSFYCSQLVIEGLKYANHNQYLIKPIRMNLRDNHGNIPKYWQELYARLNKPIPEGELGSNPNYLTQQLQYLKPINLNYQ